MMNLISYLRRLWDSFRRKPRVPNWYKARDIYKLKYPYCQFCLKKTRVDVHDVLPCHLVPNPERNTVATWYNSFISLCSNKPWGCYYKWGHCSDPQYMKYQPLIREMDKAVNDYLLRCLK